MSFDIKYDKDGVAIKQPELQARINEEANRDISSHVEAAPAREEFSPAEVEVEPETESLELDSVEEVAEVEQTKPLPKPTPPQESFKVMREKAERAERRAQEAEALLQQYASAKRQPEPEPEDSSFSIDIDEDSLVEGKHLSAVHKEVIALKRQLAQQQVLTYRDKVEAALKERYKDWGNVFNTENMKKLEDKHPDIFHTLNQSTDMYKSGVAAYTMIKTLGIVEPEDKYVEDKALAQKNSLKPRNTSSISPQTGDSPLSKVNAFATGNVSDELKAQLWKEMNAYRR